MERNTAEDIFAACERALANLMEAEIAIAQISDPVERAELMKALLSSLAEITAGVRASALRQYPDIHPPEPHGAPDTTIVEEDVAIVSQLTTIDITAIDKALLAECASSWQKVARVVGDALHSSSPNLKKVPVGYYAQRIIALVELGKPESQGNLHYIRSSEVRLPNDSKSAA